MLSLCGNVDVEAIAENRLIHEPRLVPALKTQTPAWYKQNKNDDSKKNVNAPGKILSPIFLCRNRHLFVFFYLNKALFNST